MAVYAGAAEDREVFQLLLTFFADVFTPLLHDEMREEELHEAVYLFCQNSFPDLWTFLSQDQ